MSYGLPPGPTCNECDAELVDLDMAEDPDDPSHQWNTGRCPECDPLPSDVKAAS